MRGRPFSAPASTPAMSYALDSMDAALLSAVAASSGTFTSTERHSAIVAAGEQYLSETRAAVTRTDLTIASGAKSIDVTSTITGFVQDDMVGDTAYIDFYPVKLRGQQQIARRHQGSSSTGRPSAMAFLGDDYLLFDTEADQEYTLSFPHAARLTTFTLGTASNPTLNLPAGDAPLIARLGAKAHLLLGEEGDKREAAVAMIEFEKLIERAKTRFPDTNAAVRDRNVKS